MPTRRDSKGRFAGGGGGGRKGGGKLKGRFDAAKRSGSGVARGNPLFGKTSRKAAPFSMRTSPHGGGNRKWSSNSATGLARGARRVNHVPGSRRSQRTAVRVQRAPGLGAMRTVYKGSR